MVKDLTGQFLVTFGDLFWPSFNNFLDKLVQVALLGDSECSHVIYSRVAVLYLGVSEKVRSSVNSKDTKNLEH